SFTPLFWPICLPRSTETSVADLVPLNNVWHTVLVQVSGWKLNKQRTKFHNIGRRFLENDITGFVGSRLINSGTEFTIVELLRDRGFRVRRRSDSVGCRDFEIYSARSSCRC